MLPAAGLGSELRWLLLPRTSCPKRFHAPRNRCIHPSPPPFALCSSIFPLGVFRGAEEVQLFPGSCWTSSPSAAPPGSRCACGPRLPPSLCSVFSALCLAVSVPGGLGPASLSPLTLKAELGALGGGSRGGGGSGRGGGPGTGVERLREPPLPPAAPLRPLAIVVLYYFVLLGLLPCLLPPFYFGAPRLGALTPVTATLWEFNLFAVVSLFVFFLRSFPVPRCLYDAVPGLPPPPGGVSDQ